MIFQVLLQGELDDVKWPARIRNLIFKIEGTFGLEKMDVCYQCAVVTTWHTDKQRCTYDPKTWKFPSILENQRIFIRYHRWIYFLFTDAKEISEDYRVINLKQILSQYFNNMKSKLEEKQTKTEQYLSNTKDLSSFMRAFCYQIADTCEFCHQRVKECEEVELDTKVEKLNRFGIPNDEFVKMLVKSFGKVRETFPESVFNIDAEEFIPKHLRK